MFQKILPKIGFFLLFLLLQVLVFNHIHLFGYATPMPYIYFLLTLPTNTPRWLHLISGFLLGLFIDMFGNTPGVATITLTFMALVIPFLFILFGPRERKDKEIIIPSVESMEKGPFFRYVAVSVFLQCTLFFCIESFGFYNFVPLIISILASTLLTILFVFAIELLHKNKSNN